MLRIIMKRHYFVTVTAMCGVLGFADADFTTWLNWGGVILWALVNMVSDIPAYSY